MKQWQGKLDSLEQSLVELTDKNSIKKKELTDLNEKRRTAAKEKEEWELRVIESQKNLEGAEAKSRHMEAILTEKSVLLSEWEQRVDIETNNRMKLLEQKEEIEEKLNFCRATNQKLEEERVRSNAAFQSQVIAANSM